MKALAFIPARGGSKSIKSKNIKDFCGKPLIYWTALACELCDQIDKVVVATDSEKIAEVSNGFGFRKLEVYHRSDENAKDTSSTESVILEYLNVKTLSSSQLFILLQATSPFTTHYDLSEALEMYHSKKFDSILSGAISKRFFWEANGTPINYDYNSRPRRQDFEGVYIENGAFYINSVGNIMTNENRLSGKIGVYPMKEYTSLELDEEDDWLLGEQLMNKYHSREVATKDIRIVLTDVDGVLTDAGMYYTENGDELKKFSTYDGMAFSLLRDKGIKGGLITKENTQLVKNRAKKLKLDYEFSGIEDKVAILKQICDQEQITFDQVAYVGDDINDIPVLKIVGLAACPSNARPEVKELNNIIQFGRGERI